MKNLFFTILLSFPFVFFSQTTPKKIKYKGEELYIYPTRSEDDAEIPPAVSVLPDGKYALLHTFIFKRNKLKRKMVLTDSLRVRGVFTLKNGLPEGKAEFFTFDKKRNWSHKKKPATRVSGYYEKGEKTGEWIDENFETKSKNIYHYKNGMRHGRHMWYSKNILRLSVNFTDDEESDTLYGYNAKGKLITTYDILVPGLQTEKNSFNCYNLVYNKRSISLPSVKPIRSFLRSYDEKGRLRADIKAVDGVITYFDTIFSSATEKYFITKINNPHKDSANQFILHHIYPMYSDYQSSKSGNYRETKSWYLGEHLYKTETLSRYYKPVRSDEWEITTYNKTDSIKENSTEDIIVGYTSKRTFKEIFHLIPAIGYSWAEKIKNENGSRRTFGHYPEKIDTANHIVYTTDTFSMGYKHYYAGPMMLMSRPKEKERNESSNNYSKYHFLYGDKIPKVKAVDLYHNHPNGRYLSDYTEEYYGLLLNSTAYDSAGPLNGQYFIGYFSKQMRQVLNTKKIITAATPMLSFGKGTYANGKKTGNWEFFEYVPEKGFSADWKKNFDLQKNHRATYTLAAYANDKLNGKVEKYVTELEADFESTGPFNKKNPRLKWYTYKSSELNLVNDTLNGIQKSFYHNGKPEYTIEYKMGLLDGQFERYNRKGQQEILISFKNDRLHGSYKSFIGGKISTEATFENNALNGVYTSYSIKSGKKFLEITAEKNILKTKRTWFNNEQLQEEIIFDANSGFEFTQKYSGMQSFLETNEEYSNVPLRKKMFASARSFYDNGQLLSEGKIEAGEPAGLWKFYNINGALINQVFFKDSLCILPGDSTTTKLLGRITGYFNNGKIRCHGFVLKHTTAYDCGTRQEKTTFKIYYTDVFDFDGNTVIKNGNGKGLVCDENGLKISYGEYKNYRRQGKWLFYDPNQKLTEVGLFENDIKEGIWFSGDLEGLNFEDGACFNPDDKEAMAAFEYRKKTLTFETIHYLHNVPQSKAQFKNNQNTEIEYKKYPYKKYRHKRHKRRRSHRYHSGNPSF